MTEEEEDARTKKLGDRLRYYLRLGIEFEGEFKLEVLDDDQLWERAKKLPIDPNNLQDRVARPFQEQDKMMREAASGKLCSEEEWRKVKEKIGEVMREFEKEWPKRRKPCFSKEELLERIREYESKCMALGKPGGGG